MNGTVWTRRPGRIDTEPAPARALWTVDIKLRGYLSPWQWGGYAASSTQATRAALDELEAQGLGKAEPIVVSVLQVGV